MSIPAELSAALTGRYVVEREIGRGGMAIVYLAHDVRHRRAVAIKVLRPQREFALEAERFLREIDIAADLQHPHILPLLDSGEVDGLLYYVMPFVRGESLRTRLDRERQLPVDEAVRIAREIASALDHAHRHNVLHRDLKPANVLLADGQAVIADFGIAKAISATDVDNLTATGLAPGTPGYMSPEQAAGERILDGRSDVYALGCVLYEMLAGQPPFGGPTVESIIRQHLIVSPSSVATLRPTVSPALDRAVMRSLAKAPADRFQSAREFAAALEGSGESSLAAPSHLAKSPRLTQRSLTAFAGLALMSAVIATVILVQRTSGGIVVELATQLTHDAELELDPALSPDGKLIAYAAGPVHDTKIFVRQLSGGRAVLLTDTMTGALRWPRWSPDGSRIAFQSRDGIYIVSALGGPASRVVSSTRSRYGGVPNVHSTVWSPDGNELAYASDSAIFVLRIREGTTRKLVDAFRPGPLAWSPDQALLAYASGNPGFTSAVLSIGNIAPSAISVVPAEGGAPRMLTDRVTMNTSPAWMPDGKTLLFVSNRAGGRDIYSLRLRRDGAATDPVRLTTGMHAHTIFVSGDGRRLVYSTFRKVANIFSVAIDERRVASLADARPLTRGSQTIEGINVSADGRWLAFDSDVSGNQDIYRMPVGGGEPERLTHDPGDDFLPAWSPTGREIAFYSMRHGSRDIFVMRSDGSAQRRLTSAPGIESHPRWAPDGEQIVFHSDGEIHVMARDSTGEFGPPRRLTSGSGNRPRWSPDGQWIAYGAPGSNLRLVRASGGESRSLLSAVETGALMAEGVMSEWSSDSRTVYYQLLNPEGGWSIRAIPIHGGPSRTLLKIDDPTRPFADQFATDDRRLYFTLSTFESDAWMLTLKLN